MTHVLCTGGAGYIGSHTVVELIKSGYKVSILDNLCNSSGEVVKRLEKLTNTQIPFYSIDTTNHEQLDKLFAEQKFDAVIHYAALKSVNESVEEPLKYYSNNVNGLIELLKVMDKHECRTFVFSSSATVYKPKATIIDEESDLGPCNPYGHSKLMQEQILQDLCISNKNWRVSILRYFNPVGAHDSGIIGESPETPLNLLPYVQQVAVGRRKHVAVFGNDYSTPDGTGVRDYLHVVDLAQGHILALFKIMKDDEGKYIIHNLGTGKGTSVLELIKMFEEESGKTIPYEITDRRPGDLASVVADTSKAEKELGFIAKLSIREGCKSAWKWQSGNPNGYTPAS